MLSTSLLSKPKAAVCQFIHQKQTVCNLGVGELGRYAQNSLYEQNDQYKTAFRPKNQHLFYCKNSLVLANQEKYEKK